MAYSSFIAQEKSAEICFGRKLAASGASARISRIYRTLAFGVPSMGSAPSLRATFPSPKVISQDDVEDGAFSALPILLGVPTILHG